MNPEKIKQCSNCKFWDTEDKDMMAGNKCGCTNAMFYCDDNAHDSPMQVMDGSGYWAALCTEPDHYCSCWVKKE